MPKMIISYRRADSAAMAGRIFDRLHAHFGDQSAFMDIDNIPFGTDFRHYIQDALRDADVLVAVVGPRWLGPRDGGRPRIHDATDPVRVEIEGALKRGMPIIPVLVDGAHMPSDEELPDGLKDFAFINAATVDTGRDFQQHVTRLIRAIETILARTAAPAAQDRSAPLKPATPAEPHGPTSGARPGGVQSALELPPSEPAPSQPSPMQRTDVGAFEKPAEAPTVRRSLYPALAAAVLGVVGLVGFVAWNWKTESGAPPTAASRPPSGTPVLVPPSDPLPSNVANRQLTALVPEAQRDTASPRRDPPTAPSIRWKLQTTVPSAIPTGLPQFARRVAELSGDRMQIEILAAGSVVATFQVPDAVQTGVLDLGLLQGTFLYGKDHAFALMSGVPFGFAPAEQLEFRQRAAPVFERLLDQQNAVALPCGSFGRNGELWSKQRLATTAAIRSANLRLVGLAAEIYKELGSPVSQLPAAEIVPALERGVISGAHYGTPSEAEVLGLPAVARFYYHPGVVTPSTVLDLYIAKRKWVGLGQAGQKIIVQACGEALAAMRAERERADAATLEQLPRRGVTVSALPAEIERDLYAASRKVLARFSDESSGFRAAMAVVEDMRGRTLAARLR